MELNKLKEEKVLTEEEKKNQRFVEGMLKRMNDKQYT